MIGLPLAINALVGCHPLKAVLIFTGLLKVDGGILYREWAPEAVSLALFGDFSKHFL